MMRAAMEGSDGDESIAVSTVHPFADVVASQTLSTMNRFLSTLANLRHYPIMIEPFPIHPLSFCSDIVTPITRIRHS